MLKYHENGFKEVTCQPRGEPAPDSLLLKALLYHLGGEFQLSWREVDIADVLKLTVIQPGDGSGVVMSVKAPGDLLTWCKECKHWKNGLVVGPEGELGKSYTGESYCDELKVNTDKLFYCASFCWKCN